MADDPDLDSMIITIRDIQLAGHCPSGARRWFHGKPELNFNDFLRNGVSARVLLDTKDGLAEQVVARTIKRKADTNG